MSKLCQQKIYENQGQISLSDYENFVWLLQEKEIKVTALQRLSNLETECLLVTLYTMQS